MDGDLKTDWGRPSRPQLRTVIGMTEIDMTGRQVGQLLVLRRAPSRQYGQRYSDAQWVCKCDCGRAEILGRRRLAQIERGLALGMCSYCRRDMAATRALVASHLTGKKYMAKWTRHGALYDEIDALVCSSGDEIPEESAQDAGKGDGSTFTEWLVPLHNENGWLCEACGAHFTDGIGCMWCTDALCKRCAEEHLCMRPGCIHTLEEVGKILNISRERVRQIEVGALNKLRAVLRKET